MTSRVVFGTGAVFVMLYGVVFALSKSSKNAKNVLHKFNMWIHGVVHLIFTQETRWKPEKLDDPATLLEAKESGQEVVKKTIIFIRHGESQWNWVFNDGKSPLRFLKPSFFINLATAMFYETLDAVTGDSVFLDSPLSQEGVEQARSLSEFLEQKEPHEDKEIEKMRQILLGNETESIVCSSNLRRALVTTAIGLWPRLKKKQEKMHILSSLQESSRNVDTMSLSLPDSYPPLPVAQDSLEGFDPEKLFITAENKGNKSICEKGSVRMFEFAEWVFASNSADVIIAGGHSLYFRNFFRSFLPHSSSHAAKKHKIKNGGAVSFTFYKSKLGDKELYMVEEKSIRQIHLGFNI
mmetsp:Transcript_17109/g.28342  ORF Transcript_17109/g.28342 Transcript_17109/m.28342 type:complete len:351 (+) Transcript_17109:25-1077(+)